jgi:hypothetical protein
MKIIKIESINQHHDNREDNMDLMNVVVEYEDGIIGNVYLYRANYNRIIHQNFLAEKYGIPECELYKLGDLFLDEYEADHFYDNEE